MVRYLTGFLLAAALAMPATSQTVRTHRGGSSDGMSHRGSSHGFPIRFAQPMPPGYPPIADSGYGHQYPVGSYGYGGGYAYPGDGHLGFTFDNDWWHDRPDRAFPRWVSNNQSCQRIWWSGGGWRC